VSARLLASHVWLTPCKAHALMLGCLSACCAGYVLGERTPCALMPWVASACAELLTHVGMVVAK
jgi:hypothetical protein